MTSVERLRWNSGRLQVRFTTRSSRVAEGGVSREILPSCFLVAPRRNGNSDKTLDTLYVGEHTPFELSIALES
jgi:hypothetical protein